MKLAILGTLALLTSTAYAGDVALPFLPSDEEVPALPADTKLKELDGAEVHEKLEARVPLDLPFVDEQGQPTTLKALLADGLPTILTFNYANCPMLCSVQLGGLVNVLSKMDWHAGKQFRVVTIGLDPRQTAEKTRDTKAHYLERYKVDTAETGWRFVSGTEKSVRALADSVGYGYRYLADRNEYAHPAVMVVLSPSGVVTSYLYGVTFEPALVNKTLTSAVLGRLEESPEKFLLACFHYVPKAGNSHIARQMMRFGGLTFVVLMGGFFFWTYKRRHRHDGEECAC